MELDDPMDVDDPPPRRRRLPRLPRNEPTRRYLPDEPDMGDLETLYQGLTAPSATKLYQIARRRGLNYTQDQVTNFVRKQGVAQRFTPVPKKDPGHITSLSPNDLWQIDLIDMSRYSSVTKKAPKWIFVALRVFDRVLYCTSLINKSGFQTETPLRALIDEWGRPQTISTDAGAEYLGRFSAALEDLGIRHITAMPGDHEAMGTIDRAILTLRTRINRWMETSGSTLWHVALDRIVKEYNDTPHKTLHGNAPDDASTSEWLTSQLRLDNTLKLYKNTRLKRQQIRVGQRFRAPLKRNTFAKGFVPKWSAHVYTVERLVTGGYVESGGYLFKKKNILIVPTESTDVPTRIEREAGQRRQQERARRSLRRMDAAYIWEGDVPEETEEQTRRRAQEELMALDPAYIFEELLPRPAQPPLPRPAQQPQQQQPRPANPWAGRLRPRRG